jgi:hypothetical protein
MDTPYLKRDMGAYLLGMEFLKWIKYFFILHLKIKCGPF